MKQPTLLMILDGYGMREETKGNAVVQANTPYIDQLFSKYPNTLLGASGEDVGLPEGQMGNSEVGHLNIGAGRIVYQELTRITKSIKDGDFFTNPSLARAIDHVKKNNSALHLFGLLSDGGVHSHINHLFALLDLAKKNNIEKVYVHCFLDGRDVPPKSGVNYLQQLEDYMTENNIGEIATISGRYFAMDRDNRWERVNDAYNAITSGAGVLAANSKEAILNAYNENTTDEFVKPVVIQKNGQPVATVSTDDSVIMFNFRPDRAREITRTFVDSDFNHFERVTGFLNPLYVCMTQYDKEMPNVDVAFKPQTLSNTLGEYVSEKGLKQLRIAETEKYAHVTFFFNGGVEAPNKNEDRELIPSPKVATYDMQPEMSAYQVTNQLLDKLDSDTYDLIILNFANPDMVGHTGDMTATINALEALDGCVEKIIDKVQSLKGNVLLTSDHGNADILLDENDNIVTAHSLSKVPLILVSEQNFSLKAGILADLAPTLLSLMDLPVPSEMSGKSLLI